MRKLTGTVAVTTGYISKISPKSMCFFVLLLSLCSVECRLKFQFYIHIWLMALYI